MDHRPRKLTTADIPLYEHTDDGRGWVQWRNRFLNYVFMEFRLDREPSHWRDLRSRVDHSDFARCVVFATRTCPLAHELRGAGIASDGLAIWDWLIKRTRTYRDNVRIDTRRKIDQVTWDHTKPLVASTRDFFRHLSELRLWLVELGFDPEDAVCEDRVRQCLPRELDSILDRVWEVPFNRMETILLRHATRIDRQRQGNSGTDAPTALIAVTRYDNGDDDSDSGTDVDNKHEQYNDGTNIGAGIT